MVHIIEAATGFFYFILFGQHMWYLLAPSFSKCRLMQKDYYFYLGSPLSFIALLVVGFKFFYFYLI
jgi:hypothetical protein